MSENYVDDVVACVNEARVADGKTDLLAMEYSNINNAFFTEVRIALSDINSEKSNIENVVDAVRGILGADENSDSYAEKQRMLTSVSTHLAVDVNEADGSIDIVLKFINKYIEPDPIGPFINGGLVIQGSSYHTTHAPALCKIEFAADDEEDFREVLRIMPWEMIYEPAEGEELPDQITIPIQLPPQCDQGSVHVMVYVDEVGKVPYGEVDENYDWSADSVILALDFTTTATDSGAADVAAEAMGEFEVRPLYTTITGIKVVIASEEESGGSELASAGLRPCPVYDLSRGLLGEAPVAGHWQFTLGVATAEGQNAGIEDIIFVSRAADGVDIEVPEGYDVDGLNLLTGARAGIDETGEAVFLAYKSGSSGRYSRLLAVSCEEDTEEAAEEALNELCTNAFAGGAEVRLAPPAVNQTHGYRIGLVLVYTGNTAAEVFFESGGRILSEEELAAASAAAGGSADGDGTGQECRVEDAAADTGGHVEEDMEGAEDGDGGRSAQDGDDGGADDVSRMTGEEFSSDEDDDEDDNFNVDEEAINTLSRRMSELETEREKALAINAKLQKQCSGILARIGRDAQTRGGADVGDGDAPQPASTENNSEKESHFAETILAISDGRAKLVRQQAEYDQLALDLQARLDDKEFKAEEINDSLNEFKREILLKAENSRTAKGISRRLIRHFEVSEQKKDSELEKVRLRNISLKTTLRRLEKTLRSREQLAEGLHMIDFEQLKIENQTLSEKIEERNEELAKLKRKKTVTVQILTHIREKLRHVTNQNKVVREELLGVDRSIVHARSNLTVSKHDRDVVREENVELKRQRGFATSDMLIIDFEKRKSTIDELSHSIKELRERHFLLSQQIATNQMTIRAANGLQTTQLPPIGKKR